MTVHDRTRLTGRLHFLFVRFDGADPLALRPDSGNISDPPKSLAAQGFSTPLPQGFKRRIRSVAQAHVQRSSLPRRGCCIVDFAGFDNLYTNNIVETSCGA